MVLTEADSVCCPPPLFHCFGLVLGLLACITHGATFVIPSETFDPAAVLSSLRQEKCTALHGVPTMFIRELELLKAEEKGSQPIKLRTGIAAGSPVSAALMDQLRTVFGLPDLTITYGKYA
jgi:acyl-CoA synthetase (AMP-forming)/AMP-acid ligase II